MPTTQSHTADRPFSHPFRSKEQRGILTACAAMVPLAGLLAGCGMAGSVATSPVQTPAGGAVHLQGKVFGGQNPIAGAAILMYAAGKTGIGSAARSMLTTPVYTDAGGNFNVTGLYSCNSGDQVYMVATGGDTGAGTNSAIALMAALGSCAVLQANAATTTITMNEASTVASVVAMQSFMTDAQNLGADYSNQAGMDALISAFANVHTMIDPSTAIVPQTSTGNGIVPQTTIYSLANSLASCINSSPTSSSACANLFTDTTTSASTPTDTLQATINIANNPSQHASDIYYLAGLTPPFQPTLSGPPTTYAISVSHPSDVLTYHNDNSRDGVQSYEQTLTPANVNTTQFGKLYTYPVDSYLFAQPLYVGGQGMPDGAVHNVVYAATTHGTVYAFDADGGNPSAGYLWSVSLVPSGERYPVAADYGNCGNPPEAGIVGTPVIDRAAQTMYVVVKTVSTTSSTYYHRLHAISLLDGTERSGSPTVINPSFAGTGAGASGGTILFNGQTQNERSALLLAPNASGTNTVWISYASHCDIGPYHGIILGYDGTSLSNTATFIDTPNGDDGGIWMSSGGLAADASGYIYASTGNGTFDVNLGGTDLGDAVIKLAPPAGPSAGAMTVSDYFVPSDQATLDEHDLDVGGSEAILLSDPNSGPAPHLIIANDKNGTVYLISTDHMNHYDTGSGGGNNDIQDFTAGGTFIYNFAFFNDMLYTSTPIKAYSFTPGTLMLAGSFNTTPVAQLGNTASPVVSANGATNGLVWAEDTSGTMYAYTPSLSEVYSTAQAPSNRDTPATFVKFTSPVIANGKVYLSGQGALVVYGLLP